jgi:hypothetical protein
MTLVDTGTRRLVENSHEIHGQRTVSNAVDECTEQGTTGIEQCSEKGNNTNRRKPFGITGKHGCKGIASSSWVGYFPFTQLQTFIHLSITKNAIIYNVNLSTMPRKATNSVQATVLTHIWMSRASSATLFTYDEMRKNDSSQNIVLQVLRKK